MSEDWTREEFATALRAEIERDGVPCYVSDDELLWAFLEPLIKARLRALRAYAALSEPARRATEACDALTDKLETAAAFERAREGIRTLPTVPSDV